MDLNSFNGKMIFVTGATGLIGQTLIRRVLKFNRDNGGSIKVIASVRNIEKAHGIFGEDHSEEELSYVVSDICSIPLRIWALITLSMLQATLQAGRSSRSRWK